MSQILYAVTALKDSKPVGAFVIARNRDDAAAKASKRLGPDGKLTHIIEVSDARLGTLQRNGLLALCPDEDKVTFLADTLLEIVAVQMKQVTTLRTALGSIMDVLKMRLGLKQYKFTVVEKSGLVQLHECFVHDIEQARARAEDFAVDTYGEGAQVMKITEVTRE